MAMYTDDVLKKRMALRRHPGIAAAIDRWWGAVPKSNRLVVAKELERVDRFGYLKMNVNIQVCLNRRPRARTLWGTNAPTSLPGTGRRTTLPSSPCHIVHTQKHMYRHI